MCLQAILNFFKKDKDIREDKKVATQDNKNEFTFTFDKLPSSVGELNSFKEASLDTPYKTTALAMLVLCTYKDNKELCYELLNALRGPSPLSAYDKQFLNDRLKGKEYKPFSFFKGATPANSYTPTKPYTITVKSNQYSFTEENYAILFLHSSGADSDREVKLRKKPSTGEWFINDILTLADIRIPTKDDPWA